MTRLIVGNGARNLSKARTENNRQRGYCSEVHRCFSGRRGGDQSHPRVRNYEFMQLPLRKKRNTGSYDDFGLVSQGEADSCGKMAVRVRKEVEDWIRKNHADKIG